MSKYLLREEFNIIPENVRQSKILIARKRSLRLKADGKIKTALKKLETGDFRGAKTDLIDARKFIQDALKLVRSLGERGTGERTIQDDIEDLWRKIINQEKE